jgi:hypothetical protein
MLEQHKYLSKLFKLLPQLGQPLPQDRVLVLLLALHQLDGYELLLHVGDRVVGRRLAQLLLVLLELLDAGPQVPDYDLVLRLPQPDLDQLVLEALDQLLLLRQELRLERGFLQRGLDGRGALKEYKLKFKKMSTLLITY